ncbi:hypothetical protein GCM10027052_30130 [Parafrigoribacterium mesophilum]|uniref:hypothetical protein n=1 Tax=Parafrigoribacterium mesophilum TaxID=433646 RepID=UPI0031FD6FAF
MDQQARERLSQLERVADTPFALEVPPSPPQKVVRRIHPAWLAPVIAGAMAAGYFGATIAVAGPPPPTPATPSPVVSSPVFLSPEPPSSGTSPVDESSSVREADAWFDTVRRDTGPILDPRVLHDLKIDPAAIRFVQVNADGLQVWVAKGTNGDYCVVAVDGSGPFAACTPVRIFGTAGLTLSVNNYSVTWGGSSVTVSSSRPLAAP